MHFIGICLLFGAVGMFDLTMLGLVRGMPLKALHRLIPFGVMGFCLSVASGFCFVVSAPDQYLYNPAWQIKMALLASAGLNMVLFYATAGRRVNALGPADPIPFSARVFAGVSLACWLGVMTCGRVITAFRPPSWFWCAWCS